MPGGDALKRIPQHLIAAGALIDREIALEHRTLRAEGGDAGLDIGPSGLLQILRGGRLGLYCPRHSSPQPRRRTRSRQAISIPPAPSARYIEPACSYSVARMLWPLPTS